MFIEIIAETVVTYCTILPMLPPNQNLMNTMLPIKKKKKDYICLTPLLLGMAMLPNSGQWDIRDCDEELPRNVWKGERPCNSLFPSSCFQL